MVRRKQKNVKSATAQLEFDYSPHPAAKMEEAVVRNLKKNTGKTLEEFAKLLKKQNIKDKKQAINWLKEKYQLGPIQAAFVYELSFGKGSLKDQNPQLLVDSQFAGAKADLRPVYNALVALCLKLGSDIAIKPGKSIVPIYRTHVIAQIKASTNTRIDLGLALGKTKATGRLIDTGGYIKGDRITHRIPISTRSDIDSEVKKWLAVAYESDGDKK
jgi:hypothetical protein